MEEPTQHKNEFKVERVWDFPTRLFHWLLATSVIAGYFIGENLSFTNIEWHFRLGYLVGALVTFRIIWGFLGASASRFTSFFPTPKRVKNYLPQMLSRQPSGTKGHNPIGAFSVFALLFVLTFQVISGLLTYSDDFFTGGPLSGFMSESNQQLAGWLHHEVGHILFALVLLHFAAIAFYCFWKRENLIKPMITGLKKVAIKEK